MKVKGFAIGTMALSMMALSCSMNRVSVENIRNGVLLKAKHHNMSLQFYSGDIVRITKWHPDGTSDFRSHGSETPREIWEMGEFTNTLIEFDNLRYRLMPYIYSLAWKITSEDYTLMRGLPMDFSTDKETYSISDQYLFGPSLMVCPVKEYMMHRPPENSTLIAPEFFRTKEGKPGLNASYYKDNKYRTPGMEKIDANINVFWYTGRPDYVSDSMYAIRWEGKLVAGETGKHQFHMKCFDAKRIILDGDTLPIVYTSVEQYTGFVNLKAGRSG